MTSNLSSITVSVPSGDGYEQPAEAGVRGSIAAKWRRMPAVDQNGRPVATQAETNVVDVVPTPGQPVSMVAALMSAAKACGANPAGLADSESFMTSVGPISPSDTAGLQQAVLDAMAANPSLAIQPVGSGMRPNRAQGGSATGGAVPSHAPSTLERIHEQAAKQMGQPLPPGSTV